MLARALRAVGALLLAVALLAPPASAQSTRGFLWEAKRGNDRVLLAGTIHVGRPEFGLFRADELAQLSRAEVLAFEANVFDAQAGLAAAQRWAMYPEGSPGLEARLDPALRARVDALALRGGADPAICCRMKPWMLANTLVVLEAARAGLSPAYGSEALLYALATRLGRPIVEIESIEAQLRLFDEASAETQFDYLRHVVETIESGASRAEIERLVSAWERSDAREMERLLAEMSRSTRASERFVLDRVIKGRHQKMLAAIERYAGSGKLHLVAIGALHYFGPDGLLQGLRGRGFALRPLP